MGGARGVATYHPSPSGAAAIRCSPPQEPLFFRETPRARDHPPKNNYSFREASCHEVAWRTLFPPRKGLVSSSFPLPCFFRRRLRPQAAAKGEALEAGALGGGALERGAVQCGALGAGALEGGALEAGTLEGGAVEAGAWECCAMWAGALEAGALEGGALEGGALEAGALEAAAVKAMAGCWRLRGWLAVDSYWETLAFRRRWVRNTRRSNVFQPNS